MLDTKTVSSGRTLVRISCWETDNEGEWTPNHLVAQSGRTACKVIPPNYASTRYVFHDRLSPKILCPFCLGDSDLP